MRILITGANRGIGQALANKYRDDGHTVIATSRDGSTGTALDVTDASSFADLVQTLGDEPLDLVVCNAGVYLDKGHGIDAGYPADMWAQMFAVNVSGVFLTVQSTLNNLRKANAPKIAIISSKMASQELAPGGSYIYRSSKAAALNLGRNLAMDLKGDGIAVGIYHPGWVRTDMGGASADIGVEAAAQGLVMRFDDLSLTTSGCFQTWDGETLPY